MIEGKSIVTVYLKQNFTVLKKSYTFYKKDALFLKT